MELSVGTTAFYADRPEDGPYLVSFVTSHGENGDCLTKAETIALRDWLTEAINAHPTSEQR